MWGRCLGGTHPWTTSVAILAQLVFDLVLDFLFGLECRAPLPNAYQNSIFTGNGLQAQPLNPSWYGLEAALAAPI